jgi:hypothetical protein
MSLSINTLRLEELTDLLRAADPAAVLVRPRLLRRVIKRHRNVPGIGLQVPHRKSYVVDQEELLRIVSLHDLGVTPDHPLPQTVVLLASPSPETLAVAPADTILLKYWRLLFHASIHRALEERVRHGRLSAFGVRERIERIGHVEFEEIRTVLQQEEYLLPPAHELEAYIEFAAVYLEMRYFVAVLLPVYFPAITDFSRVDRVLAEDVDADALFARARPKGAPEPAPPVEETGEEVDDDVPEPPDSLTSAEPSFETFCKLVRRARRASKRGNSVRAAILRARAARVAPVEQRESTWAAARAELQRLGDRLQTALGLERRDADRWRSALTSLLVPAALGVWPAETRLLSDLQKACLDVERELYAVEPVEWVLSLGARPVPRRVPCQKDVLVLKHLRAAVRWLKRARLTDRDRQRLANLCREAIIRVQDRIRQRLRPLIGRALEDVGLKPSNLPERVAAHKLVEELLDRVIERGFLNLGDLRDAISRNDLKFPDLSRPRQFWDAGGLLCADRHLARALDGVYRRAEVYLRWLHRLSALAFGTWWGRFLTRYVALPFGGAFVALEGVQHVVGWPVRRLTGVRIHLMNRYSVALVGLLLLGLLNVPEVRRQAVASLRFAGRVLRLLVVELPALMIRMSGMEYLWRSQALTLFRRHLAAPVGAAVAAALALGLCGMSSWDEGAGALAAFVVTALFVNTRMGRDLEEAVTDWGVRAWQRIGFDLLPGAFRVVMAAFREMVEAVDKAIYEVDEWLRFRAGEGQWALVSKAIVGGVWFYVAYAVRFAINVLIEPQINPIKHFPVVTVSHKLVLAFFVPPFTQLLSLTMETALAGTVAVTIGFMIPGFFGFLVWELKENWRLYRANRPPTLRPVIVGHHGETMPRLLRPGFHSGTIPKLLARRRRAERSALRRANWRSARKYRAMLHHVEGSVRDFIERELCFLLNESGSCGPRLSVGAVRLATNQIGIELLGADGGALHVRLEEIPGTLSGRIGRHNLLTSLTPDQCGALETALAGLYKRSGVAQAITGRAETVDTRVARDAALDGVVASSNTSGTLAAVLAFGEMTITWSRWVEAWELCPKHRAEWNVVPSGSILPLVPAEGLAPST